MLEFIKNIIKTFNCIGYYQIALQSDYTNLYFH